MLKSSGPENRGPCSLKYADQKVAGMDDLRVSLDNLLYNK